ncbi:MAG: pilus assembly protein PilP [Syntrophales bacterium]|nr:pilus assembly protein PilP [Syntrophales bacterium]MDD5231948.1 pilus assembly protein PilP [Syntrophales bacterium]MDD5531461.1 pilus assembly protein PilP [Syntrophales bacterium]HPL63639.1 pilus assembly protein PilP [Syntrophales bacterium]
MKRRNSIRFLFSCLVIPAVLSGYGWCAEVAQKEDPSRTEVYKYDPAGKPDPFRPLVRESTGRKPGEAGFISPLQRQDIGQFKLIGVAGSGKKRMAMVVDKKGKSYILTPGTPIGLNQGRVAMILGDQLIVEEKIKGSFGKTKTNRLTLKLYRFMDEDAP